MGLKVEDDGEFWSDTNKLLLLLLLLLVLLLLL